MIYCLIIMVFCYVGLARNAAEVQPHGDESGWINSGNYYTALLLTGNFSPEAWEGQHLDSWGKLNPHLGKLIIGLWIRFHPQREPGDAQFDQMYDWAQSLEVNAVQGTIPPRDLLLRARGVSVVFLMLMFFVLYVWVAYSWNWPAAAAAVLGPTWLWKTIPGLARAMTDPQYMLFMLLMCIAVVEMARTPIQKRLILWAFVFGVSTGLAYNVKIGGLPLGGMLLVTVLAYRARCFGVNVRQTLWVGLAVGLPTLLLVFLLNPVLWPSGGMIRMLYFPKMFFEWRDLYTTLDVRYLETPLERIAEIVKRPLFGWHRQPQALFLYLGSGRIAVRLYRSVRTREADWLAAVGLVLLVHFVFLSLFLPCNWGRYFFPFSTLLLVPAGVGAATAVGAVLRRIGLPLKALATPRMQRAPSGVT